jgi:hypothetical protein
MCSDGFRVTLQANILIYQKLQNKLQQLQLKLQKQALQ